MKAARKDNVGYKRLYKLYLYKLQRKIWKEIEVGK